MLAITGNIDYELKTSKTHITPNVVGFVVDVEPSGEAESLIVG